MTAGGAGSEGGVSMADDGAASRPMAVLNLGWASIENVTSAETRRSIGALEDGASAVVEVHDLERPNIAFVGEASIDTVMDGTVHRLFTGQVAAVSISSELATITISGAGVPLQESTVGGLVIGDGSDGVEMIANVLRAFGFRHDQMDIEGYSPGPTEMFLVAAPVVGLSLEADLSCLGATVTSRNPARLELPSSETLATFLASDAWVYTTVEADTVYDAEVAGLAKLDLAISAIRGLAAYSFPTLSGTRRPYDRQHTRARVVVRDVVFVGALTSNRRWLRVTTDRPSTPRLPLEEIAGLDMPRPPEEDLSDQDLSRALREWRAAADADDDLAKTTHLWRAVECYSKRSAPARLFTDAERGIALTAALTAHDWSSRQRARIESTLGAVNNAPLLARFRSTLERDQIAMPEEQLDALVATRGLRNAVEHGHALSPLEHLALDRAIAVVNRVLMSAIVSGSGR